ncbi:MAG: cell division protein ZapE [Burkholderiales bacterium]
MSQTLQTAPALNPADWYQQQLTKPGFQADAAQQAAITRLQQLHDQLIKFESVRHRPLIGWLSNEPPPRGLFLFGGVGRGKSLLMDAFFMTLPYKRKRRVHFHHFMKQVHDALNGLKNEEDPLVSVAEKISTETRVLCFDEFHVNDIADAMILGHLFENLFERGVVVVTTSNYAPDDLYKNGLQRERFLPTIALLKKNLDVLNVDGGTDYRLRTLEKLNTYHAPLGTAAEYALEETFAALSPNRDNKPVEINQRKINVKQNGLGVIWFDFDELCGGLRSQLDYLDLAQEYHTLLLSNIPQMDATQSSEARRFTWLIDILYDHRVKFMCSAAVLPEALYLAGTRSDEFARTVSRLQEMQTKQYLGSEHLA